MKILVIGLGSIGKRHLSNLFALGYKDVIAVSSKKSLDAPFDQILIFRSVEEALATRVPDAAFVCSPTSFHTEQLEQLLVKHVEKIYVEKPVSHQQEGLEHLTNLAKGYKNLIVAGYDLHFEPGYERVRDLLQQRAIGRLLSVNVFTGQHLSQWRPYEDHRKGMSAQVSMGGGVLLDLVHEFDYLWHLAGPIKKVGCFIQNSGTLEIATEEVADLLLRFDNGVAGTVHLDYLQPQLKRGAIFTGTTGVIVRDIAERFVSLANGNNVPELFSYNESKRNDRFLAIVRSFLEMPEDDRLVRLPEAIKSLEVVLAAKKSAKENRFVSLNEII